MMKLKTTLLFFIFNIVFAAVVAAQGNETVIKGRVADVRPTDQLMIYFNGSNSLAMDTVILDKKGQFVVKKVVNGVTDAVVMLRGREMATTSAACTFAVEPGKQLDMTLAETVSAGGDKYLGATFKGKDTTMASFTSSVYSLFNATRTFGHEQLASRGGFRGCKEYVDQTVAPLYKLLDSAKDKQWAQGKRNELDAQVASTLMNFATTCEQTGTPMSDDQAFKAYIATINPNDTLEAQRIMGYLTWYQTANPTEYDSYSTEGARLQHLRKYTDNQAVRNAVANIFMQTLQLYKALGLPTNQPDFRDLYEQYLLTSTDPVFCEFAETQLKSMGSSQSGQEAISFQMQTPDGKTVDFKDICSQGQVVYVDFWATWCGPCKKEIPHLAKMVERYKDNPKVKIISVSIDEDHDAWKAMVAKDNPDWDQYIIPDLATSEAINVYAISSIPRFMLFDTEGKLVNGNATRPSQPETNAKVDELLK